MCCGRKRFAVARHSTDARDHTYRELIPATFGQYVLRWSEKYLIPEELKPSTLNGYSSILSKHLLPEFGPRQIAAITTADVTDFRSRLLKAGQSAKTVSNVFNLLNRIFADAKEDQYLRVSQMPERKRTSDSQSTGREEPLGRALQPEEAQQLLAECDDTLKLVVLPGLLAGLRRGEIFALHFEDIGWEKDLIHVHRSLFWRFGKYQKVHKGEPRWTITKPKKKSIRDVDLRRS